MMSALSRKDVAELQSQFVAALMEPEAPVPDGLEVVESAHRTRRFNVYRNTVHASLAAALAARFPVIARLVGDEFFAAMARVFTERHPPRSPVLAQYGSSFAAFLETFPPVSELPYLPDIARLEWARTCAYHARDAGPLAVECLGDLSETDVAHARLSPHPAALLVRSSFPIVSIWVTNTHDEVVAAIDLDQGGQAALVTRPDLEVLVTPVSMATADLFEALQSGSALGEALTRTAEAHPGFNVGQGLAELFVAGAFDQISRVG